MSRIIKTYRKRIKHLLLGLAGFFIYRKQYNANVTKDSIFFIGTPEHGNLGDHAIAYAIKKYLQDILPGHPIIEISEAMYYNHFLNLKKHIKKTDLIIYCGGGNIGNQYANVENIRRSVIKMFPKNKIIIFPQTVYFTKDKNGRREWKKCIKLYNKHKNLTIVAREKYSFINLVRHFPSITVLLAPDIAFNLEEESGVFTRQGAAVCLRKDKERALSATDAARIEECLRRHFNDIKVIDTCTGYNIRMDQREQELEAKWFEFKKAELVVTDRLHGMVFAAITGTPCIVFGNYNHKLKGSYEWIKHLPYIRYLDHPDQLDMTIQQVCGVPGEKRYSNRFTRPFFQEIADNIRQPIS